MISSIAAFVNKFLATVKKNILPRSQEPDLARREFILNILLVSALFFVFIGFTEHLIFWEIFKYFDPSYRNNAFSISTFFVIFSFFIFLYALSRSGFFYIASYFLLGTFFVLSTYMSCKWGVEVHISLLLYILTIVMAGILISTRFAFFSTFIICFAVIVTNRLQEFGMMEVDRRWMDEQWKTPDIIMVSCILFIIATISWLSNREIEKLLARARKSEKELKAERDFLEIKVEERTKELKELQLEKMAQLYRFAEFGRLSSGLFHDLINPMNAISLNMERVKVDGPSYVGETKKCLENAISATKKMEDFIMAVRKQVSKDESKTIFSINEEIREVINVLSYKALKAKVTLNFSSFGTIETRGDAIKFSQITLNVISNAIDSYDEVKKDMGNKKREVKISLYEKEGMIVFIVKDHGAGIPKANFSKLFEPFFTTKRGAGMGLGLSLVKRITENNFNGTIEVLSEKNKGTVFIIKIPKVYA